LADGVHIRANRETLLDIVKLGELRYERRAVHWIRRILVLQLSYQQIYESACIAQTAGCILAAIILCRSR
jgi:hypothetical protein